MKSILVVLLLSVPLLVQAQRSADKLLKEVISYELQGRSAQLYQEFAKLVDRYNIDNSEENFRRFADIKVIHDLFTAEGPVNGSTVTGDSPYMWHYIDPNPRHFIIRGYEYIEDIDYPPYPSYADADRTPDLFLVDFFSDTKYIHPLYGKFSTFGWCSEREMSYAVVMQSLGYRTFIEAPGAHAWTNVEVTFLKKGNVVTYTAGVDNTYNKIRWSSVNFSRPAANTLESWYNKQVYLNDELLNGIYPSDKRTAEIYNLFNVYRR